MRFIALITALLFSSALWSQTDSLWVKANENYSAGNFEQAASLYEQIAKEKGDAWELYYNLGNAYYKQNMHGAARLNYERALRLNPENLDIINNINFLKALQTDKIDELKQLVFTQWLNNAANTFSSTGWSVVVYVLLGILLVTIIFFVIKNSSTTKKLFFAGSCLTLLLLCSSFYLGYRNRYNLLNNNEAIIYKPVVMVKSAPDFSGSDLFMIHEGLKVKLIEVRGNWARIMLYDGKSQGWIPKENMQII